jgi:tRNA/rRNA methyltransferase
MTQSDGVLDRVTIVLHRPRIPENIGAAARAACNMGISHLSVVAPQDLDLPRALKMATHSAAHLIHDMKVYSDLATALESHQFVVGTTARTGGQRKDVKTPREMASELISICRRNRVALLFGPEDRGLTNTQVQYCQALVTIPTAGFSSLNLAQAVMIVCYELLLASAGTAYRFVARLANRYELDQMYDHLQQTLLKISFLQPENPEIGMEHIRRFFSRVGLRTRDVKVVRGLCRQVDWYTRRAEEIQSLQNKRAEEEGAQ